jgi:hypothetical protein
MSNRHRGNRIRLMCFGVLCLMAVGALRAQVTVESAPLTSSELVERNTDAERLFSDAVERLDSDPTEARRLFIKSAATWERITSRGFENGRLYYNIGNAQLLAGNVAGAILNYRRAERYLAGDPNLTTNLTIARKRVQTQFEATPTNQFLRVVLFWHFDMPVRWRFQLMVWPFVACWGWLILRLLHPRLAHQPRWPSIVALALSFAMVCSLWYDRHRDLAEVDAVVMVETVGRTGPSEVGYAESFVEPLAPGVEVVILEQRGDWSLVRLRDERATWIPSSAIQSV